MKYSQEKTRKLRRIHEGRPSPLLYYRDELIGPAEEIIQDLLDRVEELEGKLLAVREAANDPRPCEPSMMDCIRS